MGRKAADAGSKPSAASKSPNGGAMAAGNGQQGAHAGRAREEEAGTGIGMADTSADQLFEQASTRLFTPDLEREEAFEITQDSVLPATQGQVGPENFKLLKVLGTGSFGKVILVQKEKGPDDGQRYAMKVLKKAVILREKKTEEHVESERHILEAIRQIPFVVHLHYAFQNRSKLHLVLDFVRGGELFTHLTRRGRFKEEEARFYIGEILLALQSLHNLGVLYRDLKLENVLIDKHGHVVLTDFGLCKEQIADHTARTYSYVGTVEYMPPEIVSSDGHGHGRAVDWWSLGCMLYELAAGNTPFYNPKSSDNNSDSISHRILHEKPRIPRHFSRHLRDVVRKLLEKDPDRRLGSGKTDAEEIKEHRFFSGLDWELLRQKKITPPFVPTIDSDDDLQNFDQDFLGMDVESRDADDSSSHPLFRNFSYVAPEVMFNTPLFPRAINLDTNARQGVDDDSTNAGASHSTTARPLTFSGQFANSARASFASARAQRDRTSPATSTPSALGKSCMTQPLSRRQRSSSAGTRPSVITIDSSDDEEESSGGKRPHHTARAARSHNHHHHHHHHDDEDGGDDDDGDDDEEQEQEQEQEEGHHPAKRPHCQHDKAPTKYKRLPVLRSGEEMVAKYTLGKELGHGAFSTCQLCTCKRTGQQFAVKIITRRGVRGISAEHEFAMLQEAQVHPNIIQVFDGYRGTLHCYIVLELGNGGELLRFIRTRYSKHSPFTEREARHLFRQILLALQHLHGLGIMHRDIKPENFVLMAKTGAPVLKLVDFGYASYFGDRRRQEQQQQQQQEQQQEQQQDGASGRERNGKKRAKKSPSLPVHDSTPTVDIWAAGLLLFRILSGKVPFRGVRAPTGFAYEHLRKIVSRGVKFPEAEWAYISSEAKDLVRMLLQPDEHALPSAEQALQHPWLQPTRQPNLDDTKPLPTPNVLRRTYGLPRMASREQLLVESDALEASGSETAAHQSGDEA